MNKPLIIALNEFKLNMASVINGAMQRDNLPCYLIEPIISDMLSQIREGSRNELQVAKDQMDNATSDVSDDSE